MPWLFSRTIFFSEVVIFPLDWDKEKTRDVLKQPFDLIKEASSIKVLTPLEIGSAIFRCRWQSLHTMSLLAEKEAPWELLREPRDLGVQFSQAWKWFLISLPSCAFLLTSRVVGHSGASKERVRRSRAL